MDDFFDFFVFCILLPALFVILIFGLVGVAENSDEKNDKRNEKRYELCLKRDMQWVDGNCVK